MALIFFPAQPGYYAGFYDDKQMNVTYFAFALMPESLQNCQRDGSRSGCLYNYSSPDDQCKGNRRGMYSDTQQPWHFV